jgi:hypothetical protein
MVSALQFVAITLFLFWALTSSMCGLLKPEADANVDFGHAESTT